MNLSPATAIDRWSPSRCSGPVVRTAREVVRSAEPESVGRARALLFAASKFFSFCEEIGVPLSEALVGRSSVIERFIATRMGPYSIATRRTLRANLRFLAATRQRAPRTPALSRSRAKPPYSPAELASYLALAETQPTESRRQRATALICLGAGAGLIGRELRSVTGKDVVSRSGGLVVLVREPARRVVPVRAEYHDRLRTLARLAGDELLCGGITLARRNVTSGLVSSLAGGADLPVLQTARLRSTWLVAVMADLGLSALLSAAGISCPQRLGDLVSYCSSPCERDLVVLLTGRR